MRAPRPCTPSPRRLGNRARRLCTRGEIAEQLAAIEARCEKRGLALAGGGIAFGGSIAYGLDTPQSDVDLRGFVLPSARDVLALRDFGTLRIEDGRDVTLYSLSKMCSLLLSCNPNAIEMLGVKGEHVLVDSQSFRTLRAHPEWFVSRKCAATFGGYATQQLRRIENAMNREDAKAVARNAARSMRSAIESVPERYPALSKCRFDVVENEGEVMLSGELREAGLGDLKAFSDSCHEIAKNAAGLAARNRKRESGKLSKHASHLIRLLRMGSEMLETGSINTWRGDDRDLLVEIKQGKWFAEAADGTRSFDDEFWELLAVEEARFERARRETSLPAGPDEESVMDFVCETHRLVVCS